MANFIILHELDNVATAIADIPKDEKIDIGAMSVVTREDIPFGHKFSLRKLADGETILKYGESIGLALGEIDEGACVHVHNVDSQRGRGDKETAQ